MLIAHGPAGYLIGAGLDRVRRRVDLVIAAVIGSLFPDLDVAGYHAGIVEGFHRATPLHWPAVWFAVIALGFSLRAARPRIGEAVIVFALSALVHCGLDMMMAPLFWAAPFHWTAYEMVEVPGGWHPYWLGFIFYWTFLPEIALWIAALWMWRVRREGPNRYECQSI